MANIFCMFTVAATLALSSLAYAQDYPTRPVRFVLGFPAGGPTDAVGRIVGSAISPAIGQPVIIDNRPGADGAIGPEIVAKSTADGHTLLLGTSSNVAAIPAMRKNPPYDARVDFAPVVFVGWASLMMVTHPAVPAKTLGELIEHAHANPGKVMAAAANPPTIFALAQIRDSGKADILNVPYKGDAAAVPDLLSGRVHVLIGGTNLLLPYVREGRLRAMAVLTRTRARSAPEVPTIVEAGIRNFSIYNWVGLFAPAKTPAANVARMEAEVHAVLKRSEVNEQFAKIGFESGNGPTRAEMPAFINDQITSWGLAARAANIMPQ